MDITEVFTNIGNQYVNAAVPLATILSVLIVVAGLSAYEFIVYRFVSHRAFYNKSFNISVAVLPFFIATIILCLQSNVVITLGTIGALAIIRFRSAVKDPVDMLYLLWSVHIGITCGCQLYEVGVLTALVATIALVVLERVSFGKKPYILVLHARSKVDDELKNILRENAKRYRIKSRNYTSRGVDYAVEVTLRDVSSLTDALSEARKVERFSLIEYDADDIV
jgi:uncharacterized membrane protein YhiD involved in acid resistance